ncbi:hypothetical protein Y032_0026g1468 [Ancylostoma ceylanicum]|uniref:Uncharacterized protein n=1 Tax=Ancylostoma ceylanicum TaxID=53326 RepID=A0A016UU31_9BILA|nr:hypothetical protein Y032_0026g1468 [Ancylostoma ceylanicum]
MPLYPNAWVQFPLLHLNERHRTAKSNFFEAEHEKTRRRGSRYSGKNVIGGKLRCRKPAVTSRLCSCCAHNRLGMWKHRQLRPSTIHAMLLSGISREPFVLGPVSSPPPERKASHCQVELLRIRTQKDAKTRKSLLWLKFKSYQESARIIIVCFTRDNS